MYKATVTKLERDSDGKWVMWVCGENGKSFNFSQSFAEKHNLATKAEREALYESCNVGDTVEYERRGSILVLLRNLSAEKDYKESVVLVNTQKEFGDDAGSRYVLAYNKDWGEFIVKESGYMLHSVLMFNGLKPNDRLLCYREKKENQYRGNTIVYGVQRYLTIEKIKEDFVAGLESNQGR